MDRCVPARLLLAVALLAAAYDIAYAERAPRPPIRVAITPVVKDGMSGVAWRAMTAETSAIWAREGIELAWGTAAGAHAALPLVFDDRELRKYDPKDVDAFGITLFAGRSQRILVSIARARRIIEQRRGLADSHESTTLDIALGMLLGRVVAHEIGHALLLTTRHSTHGLMRPHFDARDLRPSAGGQFALSHSERQTLATRFSNMEMPGQLARANVTWREMPPAPSPRRVRR
jgi:hypothetical protein